MSKSQTQNERVAAMAVQCAVELLRSQETLCHLKVKAALDKEFQTIHEPAEIWRALACSGLFKRDLASGYFSTI